MGKKGAIRSSWQCVDYKPMCKVGQGFLGLALRTDLWDHRCHALYNSGRFLFEGRLCDLFFQTCTLLKLPC